MVEIRYCLNCGKALDTNAKFCSRKCGFEYNNKIVKSASISELDKLKLNSVEIISDGVTYTVYGYNKIIKLSRQVYLDQLNGISKVHSSYMTEYLKVTYGLSEKDYFNIVVYGDKNYSRACLNCSKNLPFLGLNKDLDRSYRKYCCSKCEAEYRVKTGTYHFLSENRLNMPSMIKHDIDARIRGKLEYESGIHKFLDIDNTILMSRNQFIKNFKVNRGYTRAKLYWALLYDSNDVFKIGVTTSDLNSRANHIRGDSKPYKTIHLLVEGEIEYIADLEYFIKLKFKDYRVKPSTEVFPINKFRELIKYVKLIK